MSWAPPRASVPSLKTVNPSPPKARKLFIVTRMLVVGVISWPLTQILPTLASQVAAFGSDSYFSVEEICSVLRGGLPAAADELLLQHPASACRRSSSW